MQTAQGLSPERNLWTSCQLIECSLKSKMVTLNLWCNTRGISVKTYFMYLKGTFFFFFSGPGGSSHCVISDKVNVFWILISPETLLSSVIRFLGLKKSRITLNLTPSSEPVATKKKKKLRESGKNPLWIHFGCRASFLSGSEANLTAH